jgi:hypothetical protein
MFITSLKIIHYVIDELEDEEELTEIEDVCESLTEDVVELVAEDNVLIALCSPVSLSNIDIILLCAVNTVTIKNAGMISETTKSTKLNTELERSAPVSTKMKTQ